MKKILFLILLCSVLALESMGQAGNYCGFADYVDGENLRRAGMYEKALHEFSKSIKREPTNYKYFYVVAMTLFQMKKVDSALVVADKVIALNPNFAPTYTFPISISFPISCLSLFLCVKTLKKSYN